MSKQMVCSFFPAHCSRIFEPFLPRIFELLYPSDVEETCPEQHISVVWNKNTAVDIRRPFLAVFALMGILIGMVGAVRPLIIHNGSRSNDTGRARNLVNMGNDFYWAVAFASFGMMNLNGLCLHCLTTSTKISALEQPLLWVGDTFTTGVFGTALWAAAMMEALDSTTRQEPPPKWNISNIKAIIHRIWKAINLIGVGAIAVFAVLGYEDDNRSTIPGTLPLELWYFIPPTTLAPHALVLMMVLCDFPKILKAFFAMSYIILLVAVADPWLCRLVGNSMLDLWTTPTLFFATSDVLFLGIGLWLEQRQQQEKEKNA